MKSPAPDRAPNRLAAEPSPYLRQHAHNPVDWYPWGEEAFEKARREDLPVFLSIGYSACHWCHVMERESFEDEAIAALLNERFVSIKVDREERPDVDDVYMTAVQAISGHGGWPLSVFLLPDGRPFFGGTYFPPEDRPGRPGFPTMLLRISETFRRHRRGVEGSAEKLVEEIERHGSLTQRAGRHPLGPPLLDALTEALARSFDARFGGFGGAPKFPPHLALEWLLRRAAAGDSRARSLAVATLDAMALGGIHDHLGGGFHRYSTDARWLLPHFEKMLTDNAQLLAVYSRAFAVTGSELYRRVARGAGDYLLAEMRGPEGAFYAATDADSEGVEGKFFVWSEEELRAVLGTDDAFFCQAYQVRPEGNYREEATGEGTGLNVLHLAEEPSGEEEKRLAPLREKLKAVRAGRVPPALDDKRVAGWNALAVSGLAVAAGALGEPRYLEAARQAARFLLGPMRDGAGRLLRTWKDGQARIVAFLEDEAFLAHALLDLAAAEADGASRSAWRREARLVVEGMKRRFLRPEGFAFTGEGNETLLCPMRDLFDKAIPSASGAAVRAMVRLAVVERDAALALEAWDHLDEVSGLMARAPHGTETWALALDELLSSGLVELEAEGDEREAASLPVLPAARPSPAGEPVQVRAEPPGGPVARGETLEVTVTVSVADGYALTGAAGLTVEAWGGPDLVKSAVVVPPPATVRHPDGSTEPGYAGEVPVTLVFAVAPAAAAGDHLVSVVVKARACGAGSCLPERAFSLSLPVSVGP